MRGTTPVSIKIWQTEPSCCNRVRFLSAERHQRAVSGNCCPNGKKSESTSLTCPPSLSNFKRSARRSPGDPKGEFAFSVRFSLAAASFGANDANYVENDRVVNTQKPLATTKNGAISLTFRAYAKEWTSWTSKDASSLRSSASANVRLTKMIAIK